MAVFSPTVIPAKAGIHNLNGVDEADMVRLWIPACAGMTREPGR